MGLFAKREKIVGMRKKDPERVIGGEFDHYITYMNGNFMTKLILLTMNIN